MSHPNTGDTGAGDVLDEVTESIPLLRPEYASDRMRELGEELHALLYKRDQQRTEALDGQIAVLKGKMRRGPRLQAGEFLCDGRYWLLRKLSNDKDSERWQALDRTRGEAASLRVMQGDWVTDDAEVEAFAARARALGSWQHPGVARVLDAGMSDEGFVYLVTEWVGAVPLAEAATAPGFDGTDALQLALEVGAALKAVHDHGVVHGAVQPANVMLAEDGAAWLTNFAYSRTSSDSSLYDAPESMQRGASRSPQADVYSLGMTLMFTFHRQELPFWVLRDPTRLIESLDAPPTVRALLMKAVEWDLDKRWPDTDRMVAPIRSDAGLVRALADRAASRGRLDVAAGHLEALLALAPADALDLRGRLGELYTAMEKFDRAREHLLGALEVATRGPSSTAEPAAAPLLNGLVQLAAATGSWRELADGLVALARQRSGGVATLLLRTSAKVYEDELHDAAAASTAWAGVSEHHQDAVTGREALEARRRLAERLEAWADFVAASEALLPYLKLGERGPVQYQIGRARLLHLEDDDAALAWLQRAEEDGQSLVDLADRLEDAWAARGAWGRVIDMMAQRAESENKVEASKILLRAGLIATSVHEEDLAIRVYRMLLEKVPDHTVALRNLARILHRRREQPEAERLFGELLSSFKGKNPKEPEASERAADYTAWARILLRQGRGDEAEELLQEALRLNPNLIQGLRVAGPLYLDRGEPDKAGEMFDRLLVLYRAVDMSRAKTRACLGNSDVAWMQGRLTEAMGWANRALDVERDDVSGWWGLARSALAARGGHPGADRAPWLMAVPRRFTPFEALARLLAGVIDPKQAIAWLRRTGMGRGMVDGGDSPMRLACCLVDVLTRYQLVEPDFFDRLTAARPEWKGPIASVSSLWFQGELSFPVAESYRWSRAVVPHDFDPAFERELLAPPPELTGVKSDDLRKDEAWKELLGGKKPAGPPAAAPVPTKATSLDEDVLPEVTLDGKKGRVLTLWSDSTETQGRLGKVSVTLRRAGHAVYLEAAKGLTVDGQPTSRARLKGGETLVAGREAAVIRLGSIGLDVPLPDAPKAGDADEPTAPEAPAADAPPAPVAEAPVKASAPPAAAAPAPEPPAPAAPVSGSPPASPTPAPTPAPAPTRTPGPAPVVERTKAVVAAPPSLSPVADPAELPGVEADDGGISAFRAEVETRPAVEIAPPAQVDSAATTSDDEDSEVVRGAPGRLVAGRAEAPEAPRLASDLDDASDEPEPTEPAMVNPALGHAATILRNMTPPIPERREPTPPPAPPAREERGAGPVARAAAGEAKRSAGTTIVPEQAPDGPTARVEVMSGPVRGTVRHVGTRLVIGAGAEAGLVLSGDSRLVANHCEVVRDGDRYVLRDLGGEAGTVINGQKVKERDLEGGEVIMVGRTVLRFLA